MSVISKIKSKISNIPGWHTNRRIVVFDSDDWGSIRMPDKEVYNKLLLKGLKVDTCPYNSYDSLASEDDLSSLFELLSQYSDRSGQPPTITANSVMVNPDFDKIRASNFEEYHYELFTETLKKYPGRSSSFKLWNEGIDSKLFYPEFHGREHLNVARWMNALKNNLPETRLAFDLSLFGLSTFVSNEDRKSYLAAFDTYDIDNSYPVEKIISEGLTLFRKIFGYSSRSFIAPNYIWPTSLEQTLAKEGIKYIKGRTTQLAPVHDSWKAKKIRHYTGQKNSFNQIHLVRNCHFEPSFNGNKDVVDNCLSQIEEAFSYRKPAIVVTHRVNFIGSVVKSNRDKSLKQFDRLLTEMQKRWSDIEFMTVNSLGDLITAKAVKQ